MFVFTVHLSHFFTRRVSQTVCVHYRTNFVENLLKTVDVITFLNGHCANVSMK